MATSLRVGILLGDQLVEERTFDGGRHGAAPITFGQSLRCALSVPVDGVPREHVLFTHERGHFELHPTRGMHVSRSEGRGKLELGDVTILFQEIATPPPAPRPQLPASIRGTFADRIDRRLAVIVGGSLLVHVAIATWAWIEDPAAGSLGLPHVAETYREEVIDITLPEPAPAPAPGPPTTSEPGTATPIAPSQTTRPIVRPTNIQHPASGDDAQRLASILTGDEASETGTGGMGKHQPGADLDKQLDDAKHHGVTIGNNEHTSRTDDRNHVHTDHDLDLKDPTLTHSPDRRQEDTSHGRITIGPIKRDGSSTLTPDVVLERINALYMAGLQRCYRWGLNEEGTLSGRVALSFTVDDGGHVIDADAHGPSHGVDSCIAKQMATWRFPIPKDGHGEPTDASFQVSLALQPS